MNLNSKLKRVVCQSLPLLMLGQFTAASLPVARGATPAVATDAKATAPVCQCAECNAAIDSGAVCDKCSARLAATAVNGTVAVGHNKRLMSTNDMLQPGSSFVYTLDNDAGRNSVAVYRRAMDGTLMPLVGSPFNAGGKGLSGGDIDEQGAIRIVGKFVLAVNPGSDSIAVFEKSPRGLLHVEGSPFPSRGSTPLSLTVHGNMVFVANQAAEFANPQSAPNVAGFRLMDNGKLMPIPDSMAMFPKGLGPAQVELSRNGKLLVATAGFQANGGEGSRIYTFRVADDGKLMSGKNSPIKPEGSTGTVGFSISPEGDHVFVSAFKNSGVIVFQVNPATAEIQQQGMPVSNDQRAACWTALTSDGRTLYVGNFVSNSISAYDVATDGRLTLLGSIPRRGVTNRDTKDIEVSADGRFLYAVGSGERQISIFKIEANRLLTELPTGQSPVVVTTGQNITGLAID